MFSTCLTETEIRRLCFERGVKHLGGQELHFICCHQSDNTVLFCCLILFHCQSDKCNLTERKRSEEFNIQQITFYKLWVFAAAQGLFRGCCFFFFSRLYDSGYWKNSDFFSLFVTICTTVIKMIGKYSSQFLPESFEVFSHNFLPRYRKEKQITCGCHSAGSHKIVLNCGSYRNK